MKRVLPIVYNGGTYGTYLHWCLLQLLSKEDLPEPFITTGPSVGNSHGFKIPVLKNIGEWQQFVQSPQDCDINRLHIKVKHNDSMVDHLNEMLNDCRQIILLYPDPASIILCVNNYFQKVWDNWWNEQFVRGYIDMAKIYENWPVSRDTPIDQVPMWIRREFLSYYLMPAWHAQLEWYFPNQWSDPRVHVITVGNVLYEFANTLQHIQQITGLNFVRPIDSLFPTHEKMMRLQKNLGQDALCRAIVDAVLSGQTMDWQSRPLPMASQAWVQWKLRRQGWEIKCHGLDEFPTHTHKLSELLIPVDK
jgi:hypothetical protein